MGNVLIIEDEVLASDKLRMLIGEIDPTMKVMAVLTTVAESVKYLANHTVDLIFLDINLADGISFKIFDQIVVDTPIIFTTAYDKYAIRAFKQNSLDYILKPVTGEELRASIAKYRKYLAPVGAYGQKLKNLLDQYEPAKDYKRRILVTYGGKAKSVATTEVAYLYAYERGVYLVTTKAETYLTDDTLDTLGDNLNPNQFYRLNRKFIISINAIEEVYRYSARKLKVSLVPPSRLDAIVPAEKIRDFKRWLNS